MSPKYFLLLLSVSFAVETVSGSTTVFPSATVQTSVFTAASTAASTATSTPPLSSSYVNIMSTLSVMPTDSVTSAVQPSSTPHDPVTSAVQPSSTSSPSSSSVFPVFTETQSTKQPTTSDLGAKGKIIGGLEMIGFAILTVLGIMVITFAIYYFFYRKRMYPEYFHSPKVNTNGQVPGEVGITHKAFVGDAESPIKVAAPEQEVKVVIESEVTPEGKGNEGPVDSAL